MTLSDQTQAAIDKAFASKAAADQAEQQHSTATDAETAAKAALDKATQAALDAHQTALSDAHAAVQALGAELGFPLP